MNTFYYDELDYTDIGGFVDFHAWKYRGEWHYQYDYYLPSSVQYGHEFVDYVISKGSIDMSETSSLEDEELVEYLTDFAEENAPDIPQDIEDEDNLDFTLCDLADLARQNGIDSLYELLEKYEGGAFLEDYEDLKEYAKSHDWEFEL